MTAVKYLLDENVDPSLQRGLDLRWPDMEAWIVGDPGAPERGTPDPDILVWCEAHNFILVTNNRASMPIHPRAHLDAGRHLPGIFILNPAMSLGETITELALVWGASRPGEFADQIKFLPIDS